MKRLFLLLFVAIVAATTVQAQQISVVSPEGTTSLYKTLQEAIEGASDGSVIYLPGGGFTISDDVKITKKLTIIGIGHKSDNDNADGYTAISGNLFFTEGSSQSAVMGCYITGKVDIGANVDDVLIRYCNLSYVNVKLSCLDTTVDQCYVRGTSNFNGANGYFTNNVASGLDKLFNGFIENNIFKGSLGSTSSYFETSYISGNVFFSKYVYFGSSCQVVDNMSKFSLREGNHVLTAEWTDVFENYNDGAVSPLSNFHFKEDYSEYEGKVGVYAGGADFDRQLAPVPHIVAKRIDGETDASGKLNVKIRVKAGQ